MDHWTGRRTTWTRALAWAVLAWVVLACLAASPAYAADATPAATAHDEQPFFVQVFSNLFNSRELMRILGQPQCTIAAFLVLNLIVFVETGLFCFLPGDSLLVTAGVVAYNTGWNLPLLLGTLCASAILGDSVGYWVGWKTGPRIFSCEKSFFFRKDHLF